MIENYDTDVYLHAWKDEEWERVPQIYDNKVKSLQIQDPFKFTHFKQGISLPHKDTVMLKRNMVMNLKKIILQ